MLGEKENYKYLGILEAGCLKQVKMKENITKDYFRRTRKLLTIQQKSHKKKKKTPEQSPL